MYTNIVKVLLCFMVIQQINCEMREISSYRSQKEFSEKSHKTNDYTTDFSSVSSAQIEEENRYHPFKKASSEIHNDDVAGIRVESKRIVFLGFDNTYYAKPLPKDFDFSDPKFFKQYPKLISVELVEIDLKRDILENLLKFLPSTLKNLSINSCQVQKDDVELINDMLEKFPQLESIVIQLFECLGEESDTILSKIPVHKNIKFLSFAFNEISHNGCTQLSNMINDSSSSIENISLAWEKIVDEKSETYQVLANSIGKVKKLTKLDLSFGEISTENLRFIINSIGKLKQVKSLAFFCGNLQSHNKIKLFENMESFRDAIKNLQNLLYLNISSNNLSSHEMQVLMQAISSMQALKYLNISGNKLDLQSAGILSEAIKENDSLETVVANNCYIDDSTFVELSKSLPNSSLRYLYFGDNLIEKPKSLPISSMKDLILVDFSQNKIDYDGAMAFAEQTKGHPTLKIVSFKRNTGIEAMDSAEKSKRDDLHVEWQLVNDNQVLFLGL
jgi:hypothetical protein